MTGGDADNGYDARGKGPAEIERDIAETRAELGAVIDALEARLAPRYLVEKGMEMMKDTLEGNGGGFGASVRANPVPVALVGAGLGWLLISAAGESGGGRRAAQAAAETVQEVGEELAGYAHARIKPRIPIAAGAAADAARDVRQRLRRAIDDYPLALALTGLLAGVALGLLLPKAAERAVEPGEG
ncbi:MAG TPA: DUF3618 domain-containing protein [Stellaceae bacterium]|nr:DUF3618 domain-containing protein [Stellaceae bacterium]